MSAPIPIAEADVRGVPVTTLDGRRCVLIDDVLYVVVWEAPDA